MSTKGRVVVIDDEVNAATALETLLREDGYQVTRAHDAQAGLQLQQHRVQGLAQHTRELLRPVTCRCQRAIGLDAGGGN